MSLIILDRDGVINHDSDEYIKSLTEWIPIDGSIEAIARLSQAGHTVVVATNQSGLGRGLFDLDDLEAMHDHLNALVLDAGGELSGIFYCPHAPSDDCACRKPRAGLIDAIERELSVSAEGASIVGDSLRDLQAGVSKHCRPYLVLTGKGQKTLSVLQTDNTEQLLNDLVVVNDLSAFADRYLA